MGILRSIKNEHVLYENTVEGTVVAIQEDDVKKIKAYFKKFKAKKDKPKEIVQGHPFIYDEEFESHKINFDDTIDVEIKNLSKLK